MFEQLRPGCQNPNTASHSNNERRAHLNPRPLKQHAAISGLVIVEVVLDSICTSLVEVVLDSICTSLVEVVLEAT
jgi:hypothetical protein